MVPLELHQLLLEEDSLVLEVEQVGHVLDQVFKLIHEVLRVVLNYLVYYAFIDEAELADLLHSISHIVYVPEQVESFLRSLECHIIDGNHLYLVLAVFIILVFSFLQLY